MLNCQGCPLAVTHTIDRKPSLIKLANFKLLCEDREMGSALWFNRQLRKERGSFHRCNTLQNSGISANSLQQELAFQGLESTAFSTPHTLVSTDLHSRQLPRTMLA
uniref:Uncharacterized protein n=1 Tax=Sphaerodactylus townsendi TaxID=933632 RepID=A0ACB8E4M6_9SAUR